MSEKQTVPADGETMNAIISSLGALVFAIVRRLPEGEREAFAFDLASMAQVQKDNGKSTSEMLLAELHRAALAAAKKPS